MQRIATVLALGALIFLSAGIDAVASPAPVDYELVLVYILDGPKIEFVFVIGNSGFKTIAALERFIAALSAGSTLRWNPGCERLGGEPLLSSPEDMAKFVSFCREHRVNFVLVPSG
jgi:hypothetical protein